MSTRCASFSTRRCGWSGSSRASRTTKPSVAKLAAAHAAAAFLRCRHCRTATTARPPKATRFSQFVTSTACVKPAPDAARVNLDADERPHLPRLEPYGGSAATGWAPARERSAHELAVELRAAPLQN